MPAPHVLLVEDHEEVRTMLRLALEHEGFEVLDAADGADALRRVDDRAWWPDLLVTDLEMPGVDGVQLLAALRARPGLAELAVIVVTATPQDPRLQPLGPDPRAAVLAKPVRLRMLAPTIRGLLAGSGS